MRPDEVDRAPGPILPSIDRVPIHRREAEVVAPGIDPGLHVVDEVVGVGPDQLADFAVVPDRDERLRVDLERFIAAEE